MSILRQTGTMLVIVVALAALGIALGVVLGRASRSEAGTLTLRSSAVLASGDLGLWHDRLKTNAVTSLQFEGIGVQPPLRSIVTPVEVFVENLSTSDLFLVKPCGDIFDSATAALIGTMDAEVRGLDGKRLGNTCDSPPAVKLTPGTLVRAELHIDLAPGLGSGDFSFDTLFEAVIITADVPIEPPAGMVSWWPGDGNANDIVDGNHGTLQGGAAFTTGGKVGQAFSLDGINDLVLVPDSANLKISADITVDAWIKRGVGSISPTLISKYESDPAGGGVAYALLLLSGDTPSARVRFAVYQTKNGAISRFTDTDLGVVPADVWTHVAGTFDLATQTTKIYVNGIEAPATLDPSSTAITSIFPSTAPLRIGAIRGESGVVSGFFDGLIDEVEIFNRALGAAEIRAIFEAGSAGKRKPKGIAPPAGMVAWWPLDSNASDIQGGNHGTGSNVNFVPSGKVDGAGLFDGSSSRIDITNATGASGLTELTYDAWIRIDGGSGNRRFIFVQQDRDNIGSGSFIEIRETNKLHFSVQDGSSTTQIDISSLSTLDPSPDLIHVAGTWKRNSGGADDIRVYVNGIDVTDPSSFKPVGAPASMLVDSTRWAIGFDIRGFGTFFNGLIDEVEFFNRALSAAEIRAIFEAGSAGKRKPSGIAPPAGMVSWWPGDGNASDILGGNHGTLSGDATATADGMVGQAFSFDGTGDFVLVADNPNLNITGDVTVDWWARRTMFGGDDAYMVAKGAGHMRGGNVPSVFLLVFDSLNRLISSFEREDGSSVNLIGPTVTDTNFHHYA